MICRDHELIVLTKELLIDIHSFLGATTRCWVQAPQSAYASRTGPVQPHGPINDFLYTLTGNRFAFHPRHVSSPSKPGQSYATTSGSPVKVALGSSSGSSSRGYGGLFRSSYWWSMTLLHPEGRESQPFPSVKVRLQIPASRVGGEVCSEQVSPFPRTIIARNCRC